MSESSSAPMKIMLLLLTSGLLMAAWSADGGRIADDDGHRVTSHEYSSCSAIAVLMHLPSDDKRCEDSPQTSGAKRNATAQLNVNDNSGVTLATAPVPPVEAVEPVVCEWPVDAPVPMLALAPVAAPIPVSAVEPRSAEMAYTIASRIRADYRMSCWSCRQYCGTASRRMAAACRQTRRSLAILAEGLSRNIRRIDWNARLSSGQNDNTVQRN